MTTPTDWMWTGQRAFRSLAQADAVELFRTLDDRLDPKVAVIGVLWEPFDGAPETCVEPARNGALVEAVEGLRTAALAAGAATSPLGDPRLRLPQVLQSGHVAARRALEGALAAHDAQHPVASFCSFPQRVGGYLVSVVVQLAQATVNAHRSDGHGPHHVDGSPVTLLDAVIEEFLAECAAALARPDMGRYSVLDHEIPDLMRAAGRRLMHGPGQLMHGMTDLYDVCNVISTMTYEGADGIGGMLIAPRDHAEVRPDLSLQRPASLRDYRTVRKLLEISDGGLFLLCGDGEVYGFGRSADTGGEAPAGLFLVAFTGQHRWRLSLGSRVLMEVTYGQPHLPKERLNALDFHRTVERTFPVMTGVDVDTLWTLVSAATEQRHGTMVVVSTGAALEAARLGTQAIATAPTLVTPALMRLITAIDGAVLIDTSNRCHAIGAILDGLATEAGDPARGARYNSAIRYVDSSLHACLAIVVSEDGMINVVSPRPESRPAAATSPAAS
jgi:hypothetical protein